MLKACTVCGAKEPIFSEGLKFTLKEDGESHQVMGIGGGTDTGLLFLQPMKASR